MFWEASDSYRELVPVPASSTNTDLEKILTETFSHFMRPNSLFMFMQVGILIMQQPSKSADLNPI